ncbi:hypothetical protein B0H14DRAFT_2791357 [Mycena olivaceomarginata]|nr:hypothetical protein B0H14DRAFT_2791357 [Mycena olivaceomarginata]
MPRTELHTRRNVLASMTDVDTLRFCLEHGVDPNHKDRVGRTPLHYACGHAAGLSKAFAKLLLQFGAVTLETADQRGATPVDTAMDMGYENSRTPCPEL